MNVNIKLEVFSAGNNLLSLLLRITMRRMELSVGWQGRGAEVPGGIPNSIRYESSILELNHLIGTSQ